MTQPITLSSVSEPERRLIRLLQEVPFGRIEEIRVKGGSPVFQPAPRIVRTLKMGGHNGPREEVTHEDFLLKRSVVELLEIIRTMRDDEILTVVLMHGLPHFLEIRRDGEI